MQTVLIKLPSGVRGTVVLDTTEDVTVEELSQLQVMPSRPYPLPDDERTLAMLNEAGKELVSNHATIVTQTLAKLATVLTEGAD